MKKNGRPCINGVKPLTAKEQRERARARSRGELPPVVRRQPAAEPPRLSNLISALETIRSKLSGEVPMDGYTRDELVVLTALHAGLGATLREQRLRRRVRMAKAPQLEEMAEA